MPRIREPRDRRGPERARGVHARAGVAHGEEVRRKEREPDADGRDGRRGVLLRREHEHGEHERGGDKGLDGDALRGAGARGEGGAVQTVLELDENKNAGREGGM